MSRTVAYKFRLGEVDAFRERTLVPMDNAKIVYTGTHTRTNNDFTFQAYGARGFERMANSCIMTLEVPGGDEPESFFEGDVSKVFLLTNSFGSDASFDFYYRRTNAPTSTWNLSKRISLALLTDGVIEVFADKYNVYEFKLVVTSGAVNFFGLYTYKYVTRDFHIFDYNYAFEFEINPISWKHAFDGGNLYSSTNGVITARGAGFSGSYANSSRGKIDLHFDFIRGASKTEVSNYRENVPEEDKTLLSLSHSDKYKLEYLARRNNKLILVGDEYMDIDTSWTFGRIGYVCRLVPGSLRFVRNLSKIGQTVNGVNFEYQESYSGDMSLTDLDPVI